MKCPLPKIKTFYSMGVATTASRLAESFTPNFMTVCVEGTRLAHDRRQEAGLNLFVSFERCGKE